VGVLLRDLSCVEEAAAAADAFVAVVAAVGSS